MKCEHCPYSLRCLGEPLDRVRCNGCGRVMVTVKRAKEFVWETQPLNPGVMALIRCPSPAYEEAKQLVDAYCIICRDDEQFQKLFTFEDLSDR